MSKLSITPTTCLNCGKDSTLHLAPEFKCPDLEKFKVSQICSHQLGPELYCTAIYSNAPVPSEKQELLSKITENMMNNGL